MCINKIFLKYLETIKKVELIIIHVMDYCEAFTMAIDLYDLVIIVILGIAYTD